MCPSTRNARDALVFNAMKVAQAQEEGDDDVEEETTMLRRRRRRSSQRQQTRQSQTSHTEELVEQEVVQELVDQAAKAATLSLQCDMRFIYYTGWVAHGQYS